jgi:hypothetical protein
MLEKNAAASPQDKREEEEEEGAFLERRHRLGHPPDHHWRQHVPGSMLAGRSLVPTGGGIYLDGAGGE